MQQKPPTSRLSSATLCPARSSPLTYCFFDSAGFLEIPLDGALYLRWVNLDPRWTLGRHRQRAADTQQLLPSTLPIPRARVVEEFQFELIERLAIPARILASRSRALRRTDRKQAIGPENVLATDFTFVVPDWMCVCLSLSVPRRKTDGGQACIGRSLGRAPKKNQGDCEGQPKKRVGASAQKVGGSQCLWCGERRRSRLPPFALMISSPSVVPVRSSRRRLPS